ncbi:MAG: hypothetical protein JWN20_1925 [Jatrophihabitantaceae bacterium]|nr:hypothetical protein [Jatrophihabitantaceae bacterium]
MRIHLTQVFVDDQERALGVADVGAEAERLRALGVSFVQEPRQMGLVSTAVFEDG